jgi:non-ribosomal peptide synthetase component F
MPESFEAWAASEPDRIAVEMADLSWSYGALAAEARRITARLRDVGVAPDAVVGVCAPRTPRLVAAWLGVLGAGAAYLPLDPSYPEARLTLMVDDSSAVAVLTAGRFASAFRSVTVPVIPLEPEGGGIDGGTGPAREAAALRRDGALRAYVIYTSGSTGRPKGVELTRGSLGRLFGALRARPGVGPDDRLLAVTSTSFDIATSEMLLPLALGARVVIATSDEVMDGERLQAAWERARVSGVQATPVTWTLLSGAGWPGSSPGFAVVGGERMSPALAERLAREERTYNFYGPAEATIWSSGGRVAPPRGASGAQLRTIVDLLPNDLPVGNPQSARVAVEIMLAVGEYRKGGDYAAAAFGHHRTSTLALSVARAAAATGDAANAVAWLGAAEDAAQHEPDGYLGLLGRAIDQAPEFARLRETADFGTLRARLPA